MARKVLFQKKYVPVDMQAASRRAEEIKVEAIEALVNECGVDEIQASCLLYKTLLPLMQAFKPGAVDDIITQDRDDGKAVHLTGLAEKYG